MGVVGLVQCLCHLVQDILVYFLPHSINIYTNSKSFSYLNKVVFLQVILGAVLLSR